GLVGGGVAPDHPKIKAVSRIYEKTATHEWFRFFGNVELGRNIQRGQLLERCHAVIYAIGTQNDRRLGIPGEDLVGRPRSHRPAGAIARRTSGPAARQATRV